MKSIFIIGSRRFYKEIKDLERELSKLEIKINFGSKWNFFKKDSINSEKKALLFAFKNIRKSDIIYVYCKNGYIGKSVAMEIAFAYSLKKKIISSHKIDELSARALLSKIIKPELELLSQNF